MHKRPIESSLSPVVAAMMNATLRERRWRIKDTLEGNRRQALTFDGGAIGARSVRHHDG
jgi:hypothetical protein